MSGHSVEELRRQHQQAKSKFEVAQKAMDEAHARLHAGLCAETGMMGKTVEGKRGIKIIVDDVCFLSDGRVLSYYGFALKKDGSVGVQRREIAATNLVPA